jgi:hypothetical protein
LLLTIFVWVTVLSSGRAALISAPPVVWQKVFGGPGSEAMEYVVKASDGGCLLVGQSRGGPGGSKTSAGYGLDDGWVVRLDAAGNKLWDKSFGGTDQDYLYCIAETGDGGFIAGGLSRSGATGNKTSLHFGAATDFDAWVVRMDAQGNLLWDISIGGSGNYDNIASIIENRDGSFFLGGTSASTNRACSGYGGSDYWLVKIDSGGHTLWERCYGGTSADGFGQFLPMEDGGLLLGGTSSSVPSGSKTSPRFGSDNDFWLVRVDANGTVLWDKTYGGTGEDLFRSMIRTPDGGIALLGKSASPPSGNKTSPHYGTQFTSDLWVVRLDAAGDIVWDKSYGGSGQEQPGTIQLTLDNGFVLAGSSDSLASSTKLSTNWGAGDYWLLRLDQSGNTVWEQTIGGTKSDECKGVIVAPDGGFLLAGYTLSGQNGNKTVGDSPEGDLWLVKTQPDVVLLKPLSLWRTSSASEEFKFSVTAPPGLYGLDYSEDLISWIPLQTNQLQTGPSIFSYPSAPGSSQRFYRVRSVF